MIRYTLVAGETVGLVCWSFRTPVDRALNHANNATLKRTLRSRMQARSHYRANQTRLSDEGQAGDVIELPVQTTVRASPGSTQTRHRRERLAERMRHYLIAAYRNAFGQTVADKEQGGQLWNEDRGYHHNRPTIIRVYDYYRDTYNRNRTAFLWAGLGRMAGGAVVGGLDLMQNASALARQIATSSITSVPALSPTIIISIELALASILPIVERYMVRIGKDIFWDLAWLHEAMADSSTPNQAVSLAQLYDAYPRISLSGSQTPYRYVRSARSYVGSRVTGNRSLSYGHATQHTLQGNPAEKEAGAVAYLANEQWIIIQPSYEAMLRALRRVAGVLASHMEHTIRTVTSLITENVHPYHKDFRAAMPRNNDVFNPYHRWRWISGGYAQAHRVPDPMWSKWMVVGEQERTRLVNLDFESRIIRQQFRPVLTQHLPP